MTSLKDRLEKSEEEILMSFRPARRRFIKEYIAALIWLVIAVVLIVFDLNFPFQEELINPELLGSAFFFSSAFVFFVYAETRRYVERYIITDTAVYEDIGIFANRTTNLPFMKLQRCGISRPFMEKIVGVGDVRVDAGQDFFIIKGIPNPGEVQDLIDSRMREVMGGGNVAALHQ